MGLIEQRLSEALDPCFLVLGSGEYEFEKHLGALDARGAVQKIIEMLGSTKVPGDSEFLPDTDKWDSDIRQITIRPMTFRGPSRVKAEVYRVKPGYEIHWSWPITDTKNDNEKKLRQLLSSFAYRKHSNLSEEELLQELQEIEKFLRTNPL